MNTPIVLMPSRITTSKPALATAAPIIPPTRAWEDDEGRPSTAVRTFQTIAPTSPAKIIPTESTDCSTTLLAIVAATWVPNTRKAMKLNAAAQHTATNGGRTRVATTVAIE